MVLLTVVWAILESPGCRGDRDVPDLTVRCESGCVCCRGLLPR